MWEKYYEILWDIICFLNMLVLVLNSYETRKQGASLKEILSRTAPLKLMAIENEVKPEKVG
jgi:hypothetical protein